MAELLYVSPDRLRLHPQNMRRVYPADHVAEMAASIQASGGVLQALLVVPDPERLHGYLVVDGNMRLAGAQQLGDACPLLKCEVLDAERAEQLLIMATTSALHFAKDPISEARHYRRLLDEGYTVNEISRHTGIAHAIIQGRLRWLALDPEIQDHVAAGRLPRDARVAEALQSIPDAEARTKLATRLAAHGATIESIQRACAKLVESLNIRATARAAHSPALAHSRTAYSKGKATWRGVRAAARNACQTCDVHEENLASVAEPAWEALTHAAAETCEACNLRAIETLCGQCPVVEMLRRLKETDRPAAIPLKLVMKGGSDARAVR